MPTLSVDLAFKDYQDIGVVTLVKLDGRIRASAVPLVTRGFQGRPTVPALADALVALANEVGAAWIFIDGPQGWKAPDNGLEHARVCERAPATQGKTGLPGVTKPGNYVGFITFAIDLFDALDSRGWPRLLTSAMPLSSHRCAIESFPTSAWRSLGLVPLPGKGATVPEMVLASLRSLRATFPLDVADCLSHDDLQALVAGLAGVALDDGNEAGVSISGVPPLQLDGTWREGFIVNPTRNLARTPSRLVAGSKESERPLAAERMGLLGWLFGKKTRAHGSHSPSSQTPPASGNMTFTLHEIIRFLNHEEVRATYGAVAELVGGIPQSIGKRLGPRCVGASWVVNASTGLPTGYVAPEMHPALRRRQGIITSGMELRRRMTKWKGDNTAPQSSR